MRAAIEEFSNVALVDGSKPHNILGQIARGNLSRGELIHVGRIGIFHIADQRQPQRSRCGDVGPASASMSSLTPLDLTKAADEEDIDQRAGLFPPEYSGAGINRKRDKRMRSLEAAKRARPPH